MCASLVDAGPAVVLAAEADPLALARSYPRLRYMGSKHRLLPWLHTVFQRLDFDTALDAFTGSGCVAYLLKAMGKRVTANDHLDFAHRIAQATIENDDVRLSEEDCAHLLQPAPEGHDFIARTFAGIFYTPRDLRFLDSTWAGLARLPTPRHRAVALASLVRACVKRQPRGVFTVAGDPERYKDGRRDLTLDLATHFRESVAIYNAAVFSNGRCNRALRQEIFTLDPAGYDLVYLDPPYVPRADDNCYIKRYHFLEGLVSYWQAPGTEIVPTSKVRKIPKRFTPFAYRRTAAQAFDTLFRRFRRSILVLSYSSNAYPDLEQLVGWMKRYKSQVEVFARDHRYSFGTHRQVAHHRAVVQEYLLVGR